MVDKPGKTGVPEVKDMQRNQVELTWTAAKDDGGSPVTNYVVEYCEETAFRWLPAGDGDAVLGTRCVVRGLTENTAYKFRVAAQNKVGVGEFSECALPVTVKEPVGVLPHLLSLHRLLAFVISVSMSMVGYSNCAASDVI